MKNWNIDKKTELKLEGYQEYSELDYVEHLKSYESVYAREYRKDNLRLSTRSSRYLNNIVKNLTLKNELFFTESTTPKFYIINSKQSFHFSLPGRKFFFSSGLLSKYVKNESLLYCLIVYELIRSEKNIYRKNIIFPTKTMTTNRILALMRINTVDKVEIHKWSYYLLKRAGIDPGNYLTWLQIKNRNSLDFAIQLGDTQSISREEAMFKAFLIESDQERKSIRHKGSSRKFYNLLNEIKS